MISQTWAYVGGTVGLAGAVLTNAASSDLMIPADGSSESVSVTTTISRLAVNDRVQFSSGAIRPSAISSSLNILADGAVLEEKESIIGNLLEKAIDDIDKQMEEDALLKAEKVKAEEERAQAKVRLGNRTCNMFYERNSPAIVWFFVCIYRLLLKHKLRRKPKKR